MICLYVLCKNHQLYQPEFIVYNVHSCGQTILEIMHTAVTACLGIALTTTRREKQRREKRQFDSYKHGSDMAADVREIDMMVKTVRHRQRISCWITVVRLFLKVLCSQWRSVLRSGRNPVVQDTHTHTHNASKALFQSL